MAPEKETLMVLKVDLECHRCYTRVKKALCSLPQIQDQIYKEKQNAVMIKVVCCSPDKIKDKLLSKAGKSIKAIEILEPPKKPQADKPADKPPADKPTSKPKEGSPQTPPAKPPPQADNDKPKKKPQGDGPPPAQAQAQSAQPGKPTGEPKKQEQPKPTDQAAAAMMYMQPPELIHCYPGYPVNTASYDARMSSYPPAGFGGSYYGVPPPPPPQYGYGHNPGYCVTRYEDYVSDENATGCVVM